MGYEVTRLKTTLSLNKDLPMSWIQDFTKKLTEIPEVIWRFDVPNNVITIYIDYDTDYLSHRSPAGTHEFCRGWIVRGIVEMIDSHLEDDEPLEWEVVRMLRDRLQIVKADGTAPRELRKVDLHSGTPISV